ncbi:MAG: ferritin-like domain-containing protein [Myxococcales bacterium]|nr:ferritin-like domain-containing protein [Myxococcales bacterium]
MKSADLEIILRRVLAAAIVAPLAAAACGGATTGESGVGPSDGIDAATGTTGTTGKPEKPGTDASTARPDGGRKDASMVDVDVPEEEEPDASIIPDAADAAVTCVVERPRLPDAGSCIYDVIVNCDQDPSSDFAFCDTVCTSAVAPSFGCGVVAPLNGDRYLVNCYTCGVGRRPEGFAHDGAACGESALGQYFSVIAALEAASVSAFERLERELSVHGAPASLCARARSAANDEVRHARVMGRFAREWGGAVKPPANDVMSVRPLAQVALENAVEGCVRETFGALTATMQAERATDERVRAAMRRIAADETEHAALAWSVARWANAALDAATQARIVAAMEDAIRGLEAELDLDVPHEVRQTAGLPSRGEAQTMLAGMRANLWSQSEVVARGAA